MSVRAVLCLAMANLALAIGPTVAPAIADDARSSPPALAAPTRLGGAWTALPAMPPQQVESEAWIRPDRFVALRLDEAAMRAMLAAAPREADVERPGLEDKWMTLALPAPDGAMVRFRIAESSIMEPALQEKYPEIRTYVGAGVDDPWATIRLSMTPQGFAAQVLSPTTGAWYIDRFSRASTEFYTSYWRTDLAGPAEPFRCLTVDAALEPGVRRMQLRSSGQTRRQYRLAVATAGEYTSFHGGTVPLGLAAVAAVVNRVTGIYENEFAIRFVLVAANDQIIFTNATTDPFTSPGANNSTMNAGQSAMRNAAGIGTSGFDVGHTFIRASNAGVAGAIGNACVAPPSSLTSNGSGKGRGVTGLTNPVGDPFAVDYVAHELGHQFGGRHNFNNCNGGPGDSSTIAVEPGSGSTIMGYAGICGSNNLQSNSDPYFNSLNIDQVITYVTSGSGASCPANTATGNSPPTVNAGPDYTIPIGTPFTLTAVSSADANGDAISYCWEQQNGGTTDPLPVTDLSDNPIARSWAPSLSPSRTIPRPQELRNNTTPIGEALPTTSRTMTWRCTVRDNRPGGGGVDFDTMLLTTVSTAGPFRVNSPNGGESINGTIAVTWNVANTNLAPINTGNVRILLSTDGGVTFPTVLASSVPNSGSASVTLPAIQTTTARIRIEAVGNIYFDISNSNFTINTPPGTPNLVSGGPTVVADTGGNGNANGVIDPGENTIALTIPVTNTGTNPATAVSGTLVSLTATAGVTVSAAAYPNVAFNAVASNSTPFTIAVSAAHTCGAPINLRLDLAYASGLSSSVNITLPTGTNTGSGTTCTPPAAATGACCSTTSVGTCSVLALIPCVQGGGSYLGDNSVCSPNPCTVVNGACCFPSLCVIATIENCELDEGVYQGNGTVCSPNPCAPPTGSCCFTDGSCTLVTQANCSAAWTSGGVCTPNSCPQPTGSCCFADGSCTLVTEANCTAVWTSGGVCTPNSCPQPTGSCCFADGSCSVVPQDGCSASWTIGGTCTPNTCPQPLGVCCSGTTCSLTLEPDCTGVNTRWLTAPSCNDPGNTLSPCCKADFDQSGGLSIDDLFVFLAAWFANNTQASITTNGGSPAIDDIFVYINVFFGGCP